jgi:nitrogen fixation NifU-like protein
MNDDLYHQAIMAKAKAAAGDHRLTRADASVTFDNPLCGDRVTLDIRREGQTIRAVGWQVRGCALCQAATLVIAAEAVGATEAEIGDALPALAAVLAGGEPPAGRWAELAMFRPVASHPSRHGCVQLPVEAIIALLTR